METINNYQLMSEIGKGGFGKVYQAKHITTDEIVALKVLHILDDDAIERFHREIRLLSSFRDIPSIVQIFDYGLEGNLPFYTMEYCTPGSLVNFLGYANAKLGLQILNQVGGALSVIHQRYGFHRDIKPANILLARGADGSLHAKLGDFGLARTEDTVNTFTRNPWGTRGYMSPQVSRGEDFENSDDVYSLGLTVTALMTGHPIHQGRVFSEQASAEEKRLEIILRRMLVEKRDLRLKRKKLPHRLDQKS